MKGGNPWLAVLVVLVAGLLAGAVTGWRHTLFGIPAILAGILTQYALYSINLAIITAISSATPGLVISGLNVNESILVCSLIVITLVALMYWFFGTELGSSLRATGCNPEMNKAQGINRMKVLGLAISNGLVAVAGALSSQYSGFADVNAGRGSIVIGLAAVIIGEVLGEAILGKKLNFAGHLAFVVIGGNVAGKSTTLNAIAGIWPVDTGSIVIDGQDVTGLPDFKRAPLIGRVFQDPMTGTAATMQIDENLALATRRGKRRGLKWEVTAKEREEYKEKLKVLNLGLEDWLTAKVGLLSGGQR